MEADAAFELTKCFYQDNPVYLEYIVADDDSSMKAILCHSYKLKQIDIEHFLSFVWPQTNSGQKKADYGQLPFHMPESKWLADPTHRTK
eukprot:10498623-Ditylum_brightwellii.AAC.1